MTFNSMNHIHIYMYAYINLLSKVSFHSITSNYESENNRKPLLSFDFTLLIKK